MGLEIDSSSNWLKAIEVNWEGRNYDTERWLKGLKEIRAIVGDGPFFECPTDSGAIFATAILSLDGAAKALGWEPEDSEAMEEWLQSDNWTKHETYTDFLFSVIEEMSPLG